MVAFLKITVLWIWAKFKALWLSCKTFDFRRVIVKSMHCLERAEDWSLWEPQNMRNWNNDDLRKMLVNVFWQLVWICLSYANIHFTENSSWNKRNMKYLPILKFTTSVNLTSEVSLCVQVWLQVSIAYGLLGFGVFPCSQINKEKQVYV